VKSGDQSTTAGHKRATAQDRPGEDQKSQVFMYYLTATAVTCGALVMVIEVLGSRVLGPFFGVSLFVWTSLITVTLVALALGYALGGILSDRRGTPGYLYGIILAAGILVLAIPAAKGVLLKASLPLGLRMGALVSSLLLFGPSLFLLGCVSPYIVKIAATEMKSLGRTVGFFYALSTGGSFIGTLLTGFVLIAYLGINRIFEAAGLILIAISLGYFAFFRKKYPLLVFLILPALFLFHAHTPVSKVMANGTRATEIFSKDSFYGNLKVVDYSYGPVHTRELLIDGLIQGGVDMNNGLSVYAYAYAVQYLPYMLNPSGKNCLVIGLGAGLVPMWYDKKGIRTDVVDIDPEVVAIARKFFGFNISGKTIISDARHFLMTTKENYDYVVLDVFNGDTTPGHVLSLEAIRLIKERMSDRGILAINLVGSLKEKNLMTASVVKTLESVFTVVDVYPLFNKDRDNGNMAIIAYAAPRISSNPDMFRKIPVHLLARKEIDRLMDQPFHFPGGTPSFVLTDDYNPIDIHDNWLKEIVRKNILEGTDWEILI
jgi:spermidine synthase